MNIKSGIKSKLLNHRIPRATSSGQNKTWWLPWSGIQHILALLKCSLIGIQHTQSHQFWKGALPFGYIKASWFCRHLRNGSIPKSHKFRWRSVKHGVIQVIQVMHFTRLSPETKLSVLSVPLCAAYQPGLVRLLRRKPPDASFVLFGGCSFCQGSDVLSLNVLNKN